MTVGVKTFLAKIEQIAAEEPSYRSGGYGSDGTCDCIGLIIGAIRRAGGSWTGMHGSNYAARHEVQYLEPIKTASQLKVGEAVFKALNPGDAKYSLPARYDNDPDRHDYNHVGVVVSVNPLRIRHMTTPRPKMDTAIGKWKYHGWLTKIDSGGTAQMQENVIIKGGNESVCVNMRSGPSTSSRIIYGIPQGTLAELLEATDSTWCKIQCNGKTGYVQQVFVKRPTDSSAANPTVPAGNISIPFSELEQIYDKIGNWLGRRG